MTEDQMRRHYFETKVWVRDRMVFISFIYLGGLIAFLLIASWMKENLAVAVLAAAPLLLAIKLATTDPTKEATPVKDRGIKTYR